MSNPTGFDPGCLRDARAYAYLSRRYFPEGSDLTVAWIDHSGNCFEHSEAGGGGSLQPSAAERKLIRAPVIFKQGEMSMPKFITLMDNIARLDPISLPAEIHSFSSSHAVNFCKIRLLTGEDACFRVKDGPSASDAAEKIVDLIFGLSLGEFYWRLENGSRERPPKVTFGRGGVETRVESD